LSAIRADNVHLEPDAVALINAQTLADNDLDGGGDERLARAKSSIKVESLLRVRHRGACKCNTPTMIS
jgi:hypothetical protein